VKKVEGSPKKRVRDHGLAVNPSNSPFKQNYLKLGDNQSIVVQQPDSPEKTTNRGSSENIVLGSPCRGQRCGAMALKKQVEALEEEELSFRPKISDYST